MYINQGIKRRILKSRLKVVYNKKKSVREKRRISTSSWFERRSRNQGIRGKLYGFENTGKCKHVQQIKYLQHKIQRARSKEDIWCMRSTLANILTHFDHKVIWL